MQEDRKRVVRGCICAGLGGVVWGFSGTCGQYLFAHWPVSSLWLTCVRLLSAGTILLVMALVQNAGEVRRLFASRRDLALTALYGVGGLMLWYIRKKERAAEVGEESSLPTLKGMRK